MYILKQNRYFKVNQKSTHISLLLDKRDKLMKWSAPNNICFSELKTKIFYQSMWKIPYITQNR